MELLFKKSGEILLDGEPIGACLEAFKAARDISVWNACIQSKGNDIVVNAKIAIAFHIANEQVCVVEPHENRSRVFSWIHQWAEKARIANTEIYCSVERPAEFPIQRDAANILPIDRRIRSSTS